ncbi:MAG: hypothetical protein MHMPM18_003747 [Marteilia pararefringens]
MIFNSSGFIDDLEMRERIEEILRSLRVNCRGRVDHFAASRNLSNCLLLTTLLVNANSVDYEESFFHLKLLFPPFGSTDRSASADCPLRDDTITKEMHPIDELQSKVDDSARRILKK